MVEIPDEPSDEIIRAMLAVESPAIYRDALYQPYDGPLMRKRTDERVAIARKIYAVIVAQSKTSTK
jgi:hypothetical protein